MKAKRLKYPLAALMALGMVAYATDAFLAHSFDAPRHAEHIGAWTTYHNAKYGFAVDVPASWHQTTTAAGIELYDTDAYITIRALPEESPNAHWPLDEYALARMPLLHPYFRDSVAMPVAVRSDSGIAGVQIEPCFDPAATDTAMTVWRKWAGPQATITYFPTLFAGDSNSVVVELMSVGRRNGTYDRILRSFRTMFRVLDQNALLREHFITRMETPEKSIAYVGETKGFHIDIDGDGTDELLIAGMRRTVDLTEAKCFFRVLKKNGASYERVLEHAYLENSFQESDIRILNLDNQPGYEVYLRFFDYGNELGNHSTTFIYNTPAGIRFAEMGAFAEPKDLDGDGVDEVVKAVRTYFGPGVVSSWYDIYMFQNGQFVENNLKFGRYYGRVLLPMYRSQIESATNEMSTSIVQKFRVNCLYLLHRLNKYVRWSEALSQGRPISSL